MKKFSITVLSATMLLIFNANSAFSQAVIEPNTWSVRELHNVRESSRKTHVLSGNFNKNLSFQNVNDSSTSFNTGYLMLMDTNNLVENYFRFVSTGYVRVINACQINDNIIVGLVLFNGHLQVYNSAFTCQGKWGLVAFVIKDSVVSKFIDSSKNFDFMDISANENQITVAYKKSESSNLAYKELLPTTLVEASSNYCTIGNRSKDYLQSGLSENNLLYWVERSNNSTWLKMLRRLENKWSIDSLDLITYRVISSNFVDSTLLIFLQRQDSIFVKRIKFDGAEMKLENAHVMNGDVISLKARKFGNTIYYFGSTISYATLGEKTINFDSLENSFMLVDFEGNGISDTLLNMSARNIFEYFVRNNNSVVYMDELIGNEAFESGIMTNVNHYVLGFSLNYGKNLPNKHDADQRNLELFGSNNPVIVRPNPARWTDGFGLTNMNLVDLTSVRVYDRVGREYHYTRQGDKFLIEEPGLYFLHLQYISSKEFIKIKVLVY